MDPMAQKKHDRQKTQGGNIGSKPGQVKAWTKEEMDAARPLPMPSPDPKLPSESKGNPHHGHGNISPGGRPENS